jgi:alkanesulfonate monooxygenase SsuD/methylene tetrahydromethanopterin reductase-like flavin-dependent oxidoreductase (luciferase family)
VQRDLPMWIGGSSDAAIRRTARVGTGWIAGAELPTEAGRIAAAIRDATAAAGRTIDDDHYGAGFPFHFGRPEDPAHRPAVDAFRKRTGRDPAGYFAIGTAATIFSRISAYVDAGISKFILRPIATGDEAVLQQTRQLIEQVIPRAAAAWPRS